MSHKRLTSCQDFVSGGLECQSFIFYFEREDVSPEPYSWMMTPSPTPPTPPPPPPHTHTQTQNFLAVVNWNPIIATNRPKRFRLPPVMSFVVIPNHCTCFQRKHIKTSLLVTNPPTSFSKPGLLPCLSAVSESTWPENQNSNTFVPAHSFHGEPRPRSKHAGKQHRFSSAFYQMILWFFGKPCDHFIQLGLNLQVVVENLF